MRNFFYILSFIVLASCDSTEPAENISTGEAPESKTIDLPVDKADLVVIDGDVYTEYYPDGKNIKFKGVQDENKKRHGKWVYYSLDGKELSMTMYNHGEKHGHSIVKYPNGAIYYHGEYDHDKKTGIWKTYDENGKLATEIDYTNTPGISVK